MSSELAAEFQIQLAAELGNPIPDILGLKLHVLFVVETDSVHERPPSCCVSASKPAFRLREHINSSIIS